MGDERGELTVNVHGTDFDAMYRGEATIAGEPFAKPPWDIGEAQPRLVRLVADGEIGGRVLDVGCGAGDNAIHLARCGFDVVAVDASATAIELARERAAERGAEVDFRVGDATRLDGMTGEFGTVLDSALYHCVPGAERAGYAAALHRVAEPGARLHLFTFADAERDTSVLPAAISRDELRETIGAHWRIGSIELFRYSGAFDRDTALRQFEQYTTGMDPAKIVVDAEGRATFPMWHLRATRPA